MTAEKDGPIPLSSKDLVNLLAERLRTELGPPPEREPASLTGGGLEQKPVAALLEEASRARLTGFYELWGSSSPGRQGRSIAATVSLRDGQLVAAALTHEPDVAPLDALAEMVGWQNGDYTFWDIARVKGQLLPGGTAAELLDEARHRAAARSGRSRWEQRAGRRRRNQYSVEVLEVWLLALVEALEFLDEVPARSPLQVGHDPRFLLRLRLLRVEPAGLGLAAESTVDLTIHSAAICGFELGESEGRIYELSVEREERPDGVHWDELLVERGPLTVQPSPPSR
jgi:hypothetical protein